MEVLIIIVVLPFIVFWGYQFVFLMMIEDDLFPGRFDKLIWSAVFIILWPLAPFAFLMWRGAMISQGKRKKPD